MESILTWLGTIVVLAWVVLPQIFKILREYERAVVFRLGKFRGVKGPGLIVLVPFIDRIERVDMRVLTINVTPQEVITRDNVTVQVDAVVFFRVVDAERAVIEVEQYRSATSRVSQTALRSTVGEVELDELLAEREKVNRNIQGIIDRQTDPWGIKVVSVEVRDVILPENMKRAMANQAETERNRRARVIDARGEHEAAERLVQAAEMMAEAPAALQLRYLQTMADVTEERTTFALLPMPMDFTGPFDRADSRPADEDG